MLSTGLSPPGAVTLSSQLGAAVPTVTRYLTRHLPIANELLHYLAVLHPHMLKEDPEYQVIRRTAKTLAQIIRQDYVCRLTDKWKINQGHKIPEDWYITGCQENETNIYRQVDHYWQRV